MTKLRNRAAWVHPTQTRVASAQGLAMIPTSHYESSKLLRKLQPHLCPLDTDSVLFCNLGQMLDFPPDTLLKQVGTEA